MYIVSNVFYFIFINILCSVVLECKLVTGPGVHYLVGATGDDSNMTHPSKFNDQKNGTVFIQSRAVDRELAPGTKYLFCEY